MSTYIAPGRYRNQIAFPADTDPDGIGPVVTIRLDRDFILYVLRDPDDGHVFADLHRLTPIPPELDEAWRALSGNERVLQTIMGGPVYDRIQPKVPVSVLTTDGGEVAHCDLSGLAPRAYVDVPMAWLALDH